jgi:hypothetical protein
MSFSTLKNRTEKLLFGLSLLLSFNTLFAQTNPAITSWLRNTTTYGSYYTSGNSTAISMTVLANCQKVQYSSNYVYVTTEGIPTYPTGIFSGDGNPNVAGAQGAIYKFSLNPTQNTGTATATSAGNCGVFINGVSLFDYRDGVSWNNNGGGSLCGGPGNSPCPGGMGAIQAWNRDAIPAEKLGFDCAKGHPAGTNYHHHQNPSPFKYDATTSNSYSPICSLYNSDGLYTINSAVHSPLLGFAYDGFPIYGAYGYKNLDGTGGITRMKSSYTLKSITASSTRTNGPVYTGTYFNGYFREDYVYTANAASDYLDSHNGRVCVTPEYPGGIYCYFTTVDANNTSVYPYVIGPTFYGVVSAAKVTSISESVTTYSGIVPISLINFQGKLEKKNAVLDWTSASEINSSHYIIERSTDGLHFEAIGKTPSKGNQSQKTTYAFIDENVPQGKLYYRLKQVDLDGKSESFKVISLLNTYGGFGFRVFPNPASELLVIQTDDILRSDVHVALINTLGATVAEKDFPAGSSNCFLDTQTLYSGIYQLMITENGSTKTQKVLIQKQ